MAEKIRLPKNWLQLDHDEEEHVYVQRTDNDPHYYDKSVEIVRENGGWGVYARTGRDRGAREVFHAVYPGKEQAEKKVRELIEKGFA